MTVTPFGLPNSYRLVVVSPVYDDATAATQLLEHLSRVFHGSDVTLRILLVDDGSPVPLAQQLELSGGAKAEVLRLRRNVGHQRAIALGTAYVHEHIPCDAVLVMDADGEDRPEDAADLVARCREGRGERIIFAERTRRSESVSFRLFYQFYQLLHWMLTGVHLRVGHFGVVPARQLAALVTMPALWNHYAAAIFQSRLPRELVPTVRGSRYSGRSKMNFVGLVVHGLQAISVFIEVAAVRLLLAMCGVAGVCGGALLGLAVVGLLLRDGATPLWVPYALGGLLMVALGCAFGCVLLTLGFLAQRGDAGFILARDYQWFIEGVHHLSLANEAFSEAPRRDERSNVAVSPEHTLRP